MDAAGLAWHKSVCRFCGTGCGVQLGIKNGRLVTIDVRGEAFLRGMVRRIVAALLAVGTGKLDPSAIPGLLVGDAPALDGEAAPARGLCLRRVVMGRHRTPNRTNAATG